MVEVPNFVEFLTTSKTDFIKGKHKQFGKLYEPIRQEFKTWLKEIGVQSAEVVESDEARKLERELKKLIEEVPELSEFFGFRSPKNVLSQSEKGLVGAALQEGVDLTYPEGEGERGNGLAPLDAGDAPGETLGEDAQSPQKAAPISRTAKRGPKIGFTEAPERIDMAWVDGSYIHINSAHPTYIKARSNPTAKRVYEIFSIAGAVQRFLYSESETPDMLFIDRMMAAWGKK